MIELNGIGCSAIAATIFVLLIIGYRNLPPSVAALATLTLLMLTEFLATLVSR